ncbi:MAG: hypothetical protein L3J67_10380 [Hyphomicrobiaceae bacterium]|nr:hypothetical protein [Hyphomicrobiaceae bacterium]
MKVKELRSALMELEALFEIGGTKAIKTDLCSLINFLESVDDMPLDDFFDELKAEIEKISSSGKERAKSAPVKLDEQAISYYTTELEKSQDDEAQFLVILAQMDADSRVRKVELAKISERFGDSSAKTVTKMLQSIKTRFYEKVYDRDANAMARRATPW